MYYVESMVNLSSLFLKCIIFNLTTQQNSCRTNSNLIWSVFIWCSQWSMPFIIWQNFYQVYNYICLISNLVLSVIVCVELIMFGMILHWTYFGCFSLSFFFLFFTNIIFFLTVLDNFPVEFLLHLHKKGQFSSNPYICDYLMHPGWLDYFNHTQNT